MKTTLTIKSAAQKLRSLFALLLLVGVVNVATAAPITYYTNTTGSASVAATYAATNLYTDQAHTNSYTGNIGTGDIVVVQGAAFTFNGASSGGIQVSSGSATIASTLAMAGNLLISGSGSVTLSANLTITGNVLITTTGTLAIGTTTLKLTGNLVGSDGSSQASGTLTGTTGTILFNGGTLGSSPSTNTTTGSITLGGSPSPQLLFANFGSSSFTGTFQLYNYLQLSGSTVLPSNARLKNGNTAAISSLFDLNGNAFSCGYYVSTGTTFYNLLRGSSTSSLEIKGSSNTSPASTFVLDQSNDGTSNAVNLIMTNSNTNTSNLTLYNKMYLSTTNTGTYASKLTKGIVYLNGQTVTATTYPSGSSTSYFAGGISGTAGSGFATITSPSTNGTPTVVPIGTYNTYLPVSFANTTNSPSFTVGVAALTTANVVTSASCVPFQWNITSSVNNAQSVITFYSTSINGIASTSQLGVLTASQLSGGYANMTTTLATAAASSTSGTFYTTFGTSAAPYSLPANTTANTFVIGANGAVYPLPTITNTNTTSGTAAQSGGADPSFSYTITTTTNSSSGISFSSNIATTTSNSLSINASSGVITGTSPSSNATPYSYTFSTSNIAGTGSTNLTLYFKFTDAPVVTSNTATAISNTSFSYTISATKSPTSYTAKYSGGNLPNGLTGLSLNSTSGVISGTPTCAAGSYAIILTATNANGTSTNATLTLQVLDAPTVTSISPTSALVDATSQSVTITGTNFVSGYSLPTWNGTVVPAANITSTTATALTFTIPSSGYIDHSVTSNAVGIAVKSASLIGEPAYSSSSASKTFTITVATPTFTSVSPNAIVAGAGNTTVIISGTNFSTGVTSLVWTPTGGGAATTIAATASSSTSATVILPSSLLASAGSATISIVNSVGSSTNISTSTAVATKAFNIYSDGVVWSFNSTGAPYFPSSGSISSTTPPTTFGGSPTFVGVAGFTTASIGGTGLAVAPSALPNGWPIDGSSTVSTNYSGINNSTTRNIQFQVTPTTKFTVSNIVIPVTNNANTSTMTYAIAYSLDGFLTNTVLTSGTIVNAGTTSNFTYATPFDIPSGSTLSVRIVLHTPTTTGTHTSTVNLTNVVVAGFASYASPTVTCSTADVTADVNTTYTNNLYTFAATTTQGTVTYSAVGLPTGLSIDASTGVVSGTTNGSAADVTVTFKADNANGYPTTSDVRFIVNGPVLDPAISTNGLSSASKATDGAAFTLTVTGTNFASGKSKITLNGTAITPTAYISSTSISATVPASYLAATAINTAGSNLITVGVTTTGATNVSNTKTLSINNLMPTVNALTPCGIVAGSAGFTLTIYGTNFSSAAKITFNGTQYTPSSITANQLTVSINATDITTVGTAPVVVTNTFPGSLSTTANASFIIGNASAIWSTASLTPGLSGSDISGSAPTLTNVVTSTVNGNISYGTTTGQTYPADWSDATTNSGFTGIVSVLTPSASATRSIDFIVSPGANKDMTISAISIPVTVTGAGSNVYSVAYSTDGSSFTKISTASNSGGSAGVGTVNNTYDIPVATAGATVATNCIFATPVAVSNGNSITFRVIVWRKSTTSSASTTVNLGPVTIVGNTTAVAKPGAPTITSLSDGNAQVDVYFSAPTYTGTTDISSYNVYTYSNNGATLVSTTSANVAGGVTPSYIHVGSLTNQVNYQFKIAAVNTSGEGTKSVLSSVVTPSNTTTWSITNGVGSWDHGDPNDGTQNAVINNNITLDATVLAPNKITELIGNMTSTTFSCLKLTIASGVTVTVPNTFTFTVAGGTVTNNGTITGSGTVVLNGGSNPQTITTNTSLNTGTFGNLTINTSGGVTITTGNIGVTGVLTLQSGLLTTNGNLALKSTSIANTGILAPYGASGNTGTISGNVTVERFIPLGFRGYRDIAPEVFNAGTIFKNWQENGTNTNGYGTFITGPAIYSAASNAGTTDANGFDKSGTALSNTQDYNFLPSNATPWTAFSNTNTTNLVPFRGYRLLIRGNRVPNLYTTPINEIGNNAIGMLMYNAATLRATGQLITGDVTYSKSGVTNSVTSSAFESTSYGLNNTVNGFSMVANPYVAPVQWSTVYTASGGASTSHINATYWYLDPTYSASGRYLAYNALTGSANNRVYYGSGLDSAYKSTASVGYLQPGQAVFVQTTATNPIVLFQETAKAVSSTKASIFGTATTLSKIYISLLKQGSNGFSTADGAAVAFRADFGNNIYGPQDAIKFSGANDNLSISNKGKSLSIDGRLPATDKDVISLNIGKPSTTTYQLIVDASAYSKNGFAPVLYDAYKNTTKPLGTGTTTVDFTIYTALTASFSNRFSILFTPDALPVNSIVANASINNKVATITWNTVGEKNVAHYEVEKSTDAKSFKNVGHVIAKNTATASYTTTDNSVTATTYYRIKAVNTTGAVSYSNVAKLSSINAQLSISLYPNPLKGKTLNVEMGNVLAGKYTVSIYNASGQRVSEQTISHTGGSANHAISINNALAAGAYSVTISEAGSKQLVHQNGLIVEN